MTGLKWVSVARLVGAVLPGVLSLTPCWLILAKTLIIIICVKIEISTIKTIILWYYAFKRLPLKQRVLLSSFCVNHLLFVIVRSPDRKHNQNWITRPALLCLPSQDYLHSLGKARTAQVQKDARIGEAQYKRDAVIRVKCFFLPAMSIFSSLFFNSCVVYVYGMTLWYLQFMTHNVN